MRGLLPFALGPLAIFTLSAALGCSSGNGDSGSGGASSASSSSASASSGDVGGGGAGGGGGAQPCGPDLSDPDLVLPNATDPAGGMFSMDKALIGLPKGPGPLRAIIDTDMGMLTCELRPDKAPNSVANFVGLARGTRAWKDPKSGKWVLRRFYDGLLFHRVISGFMAQGGDPLGNGTGGPGYMLKDEISDLKHIAGALAYANAGPNTDGSQFYVTETAQPSLDGKYTIFGACTPVTVVESLTHVPTSGPPNDRPITDLHIKGVTITRCAP